MSYSLAPPATMRRWSQIKPSCSTSRNLVRFVLFCLFVYALYVFMCVTCLSVSVVCSGVSKVCSRGYQREGGLIKSTKAVGILCLHFISLQQRLLPPFPCCGTSAPWPFSSCPCLIQFIHPCAVITRRRQLCFVFQRVLPHPI